MSSLWWLRESLLPGIGVLRIDLPTQMVARVLSTSVQRQNLCRLPGTPVKGTGRLSEGSPGGSPNGLWPSPVLFEGSNSSQRPFETARFTITTTIKIRAGSRLGKPELAACRVSTGVVKRQGGASILGEGFLDRSRRERAWNSAKGAIDALSRSAYLGFAQRMREHDPEMIAD